MWAVVQGLVDLHGAGLVHGDLKGDNARMILAQEVKDSHLELIDLGAACPNYSSKHWCF